MKKLLKKLLCLVVATVSMFSFVGCGKIVDKENALDIYVYNAGYGTQWALDLIDLFKKQDWVKEKYPNLEIPTPTINDVGNFVETQLSGGAKGNRFDLMFGVNMDYFIGPTGDFLDITEKVYNSLIPGEEATNVKWKDKSFESYNQSNVYIDTNELSSKKQYLTSWAGGETTIFYSEENVKAITDLYPELLQSPTGLPNTTEEFFALCQKVYDKVTEENAKASGDPTKLTLNKGKTYAVYAYAPGSYMMNTFPVFWAQYEGVQNYLNFWNGTDGIAQTRDIFKQEGRLYSLEFYERLCHPDNKYVNRNAPNLDFMEYQQNFYKGEGLFMFNGDWVDNEMADWRAGYKGTLVTVKTMRMPIISALGTKLGITDTELSKIVDYVDGTISTAPSFTSTEGYTNKEVIDAVTEARTIVYSIGPNHQAGIPTYAKGKDVAVDFLRFMASDIALESYIKSTNGASLPFKYDVKEKNPALYNTLSDLQKTRLDYFNSDKYEVYTLPSDRAFPLFQYGGLKPFTRQNPNYWPDFFSREEDSKGNPKYKTAQQYYDDTIAYWTSDEWTKALNKAGLL